jgi:hypothetical protein
MPVFPATITVQHQVWVWNTNGDGNPVLDADGNPTGQLSAPEVQGRPPTWRQGLPWQHYASLFGDTVHIRRVN